MANQPRKAETAPARDDDSATDAVETHQEPVPADAVARTATAIAQRNHELMQTFMNWLVGEAQTTDEDQYEAMAAIMGEILASDDIETMMKEATVLHAADVVGQPLLCHSYTIREGDYEDSQIGFYAALQVSAIGADKARTVTCGGMKVLAKIYKLAMAGEWPQLIVFTSKKTSSGNTVLDIVRPPVA